MPGRRLDWERSVPTPRKRWGLMAEKEGIGHPA